MVLPVSERLRGLVTGPEYEERVTAFRAGFGFVLEQTKASGGESYEGS
jgi:hypothetical protein